MTMVDDLTQMVTLTPRIQKIAVSIAEREMSDLTMRVPAEPERDADIVCSRFGEFIRTHHAEIKRNAEDAARFKWYLACNTNKSSDFMMKFMQGVREHWDISQWRIAIDAAIGDVK